MRRSTLSPAGSLSNRPLRVRMRGDLTVSRQRIGPQILWVLKDPVALEYFHLGEEEYALLQLLDGVRSAADVRRAFESRFPPQKLTASRLHWFVSKLHRQGLILADVAGQGTQLRLRRDEQRRANRWGGIFSILAVRFRGIDPEPWLKRLERRLWWVFSPLCLTGCVLMMLAAVALVTSRFDVLMSRLPALTELLKAENLVWFAVALFVVKLLHELGHALTCKHFGGECHEIGLMLLVCMPCLYCNVSDSWLLPSKWQRAAVASAGIFVELFLAALCTFAWWFTAPGVLHAVCLNVMILCSVNTVLLNGNPLLRYDGYYVLADLWEMPNLAEEVRERLRRLVLGVCLGIELVPDDPIAERHRGSLVVYGVLSVVYRWLVLIAVVTLCYTALKPWHLEKLAVALGALVLTGTFVVPAVRGIRWLGNSMGGHRIKQGRMLVSGTVVAALLAAVLLIPISFRIAADVVLEPSKAHRLYVAIPGRLVHALPAGTAVRPGDIVAELRNHDTELELARLTGEFKQQQTHLRNLQSRRNLDPQAAQQLPAAGERLAALSSRLERLTRDQEKLQLRVPVAGVVLPASRVEADERPGTLREWSGTPLDDKNLGCTLESGTLVCLVGDARDLQATLTISETAMDFVQPGQHVELKLNELPFHRLAGTVVEIAKTEQQLAMRESRSTPGLLLSGVGATSASPWQSAYQARVELQPHDHALTLRATGRARIHVESTPLGVRWYRAFRRTFGFRL